jgi:CRISPR-associated protein Cas1
MRKLLNTLYITTPDKYLSLEGENIVVLEGDKELARYPLHGFESIITYGYTGASPALMGACAKRGVNLCFMTQYGRFLARVSGEVNGNVILRRTQYRYSDDEATSMVISKNLLIGKLYNSKWVIERAKRDYPMRLDVEKLKGKSNLITDCMSKVMSAESPGQLRGIEGEAAKAYFSVFDDLILQQKEDFYINERNRRPPLDRVNAMLSFVYTLLAANCASSLETVGLDPYVGFLHRDRPGRASLALDLMEELRPVLADRFVLSMINRREVNKDMFLIKENGAVEITDDGRKVILSAWQSKKADKIKHPYLDENIEWGIVPYVQALLLARYIRGDIEGYPPFLWKA